MAIVIQIVIAIALALLSYALAPKPKMPKPGASSDLEKPTSEAGRPMNVVFGDGIVKSPNCLWSGDVSTTIQKVKA